MSDVTDLLVVEGDAVGEAINAINSSPAKIAIVVDGERRLLGTVTDGDVRRGLLDKVTLDANVSTIMNSHPLAGRFGESLEGLRSQMADRGIVAVPLVDESGKVVALHYGKSKTEHPSLPNAALIMAGGLGTRLRPLTESMPKPMVSVGERPLIETTVLNLRDHGIRRIFISVNYLAEVIEDHFGDGSELDLEIHYLREQESLGTAGALALFPEVPTHPLVVMNGDLITDVNYEFLLDFHSHMEAAGTMCVRTHHIQLPYGIVRVNGEIIHGIEEKPRLHYLVNAGIYVLSPAVIAEARRITGGEAMDMPEFFERLRLAGQRTVAFPMHEYWRDIARVSDYEEAKRDYERNRSR